MYQYDLAGKIKNKAIELGFEGCGIVKLDELRDYEGALEQRLKDCPESKPMLEYMRKYVKPEISYPWAKAVVVCVVSYGKYKIPENLAGLIGKYYLCDHKLQQESRVTKSIAEFEEYFTRLGIRSSRELHGVTAMRWAAYKAGLGIIRKNNFLYTEYGSWVIIETWVIDHELEWKETNDLAACPQNCTKCIDACPSKALKKSFCTNMAACITRLTWGAGDLLSESLDEAIGKWIYGCDECQNVCPQNCTTQIEEEELPGLSELAEELSLTKILTMNEERMKEILMPKFWFIQPENFWLWKVNALRAMTNDFKPEYKEYIIGASKDENEKVKGMAIRSLNKLELI